MASKVKKGFFYYILWLFFIILGIFLVLAAVLIMNPGKDIFKINLCWMQDTSKATYQKVDETYFSALSISTVEFSSQCTNFSVVRDSEYQIMTIELNKNVLGFGEPENVKYEFKMTHTGTTLKINITEPVLKFAFGNSSITIHCPMDSDFNNIAFIINSTKGSATFGSSNKETEISIKDIDANIGNGNITLHSNVDVLSNTLDIDAKSTNINIYTDITSNININSEICSLKINKISGNLNVTAKNEIKLDAHKILGNVKTSSAKGYIKVDELGDFEKHTGGNLTSEIDKAHIANIIIGKMQGVLTLPSAQKSDVTIGELMGEALISTTSGNVKITNAYADLSITTLSGSVRFTQNSERATNNISTLSGKIYARFNNIKNAELQSEKGTINIYVKNGLDFAIDYNIGKKINVSWITTPLNKTGKINSPTASASPKSKITVLTNSSLYVENFQ